MSRKAPKYNEETKGLLRRHGENHLSPAFVFAHMNERDQDRKSFVWKQRLRPSGMSFDMCMEEFQDTCDRYNEFPIPQRIKFGFGNAVHKYLAELFKKHNDILYAPPNVDPSVRAWMEKIWAEIPVSSDYYQSKMVADMVAKIKGLPVVVDWKTTWQEPKEWAKFCKTPIVPVSYLTQAASYVFHMNREKYYPVEIQQFGFVFINLCVQQDERDAWREVWYEFSPFADSIQALWDVALEALIAKIEGRRVPCKNVGCPKDGSGVITLSEVDPWKPAMPPFLQELENLELNGSNTRMAFD